MAYVLNIETSTTNCSVALSKSGSVVAYKEDNSLGYSHAERLHVYIDEVLQTAKVSIDQVDAIAISKGPGSYTGLRIGVSAAKGLCYALDVPLISVPTLEALAHQVDAPKGAVVAMLDARRQEVYSAIFDDHFSELRSTEAEVLSPESYQELLESSPVYFIGNGVSKTKVLITHKNAHFIEDKLPSAQQMCALSFEKYKAKNFEDVAYFEPFYLKDFIAIPSKK
ncbi:MAG: tRNA (adenosine(37)-N6)-threonylcarbamoyltransferase complex dimerization subunit type 1 TsaB [Flavobacteriaceae bacterium]|nr:tRNA (adenosine(37)-N6)-threonylcarbamoyltransferase complex dimerization subunit type 1 TsaB [Flavobacteriaceae bacterium]